MVTHYCKNVIATIFWIILEQKVSNTNWINLASKVYWRKTKWTSYYGSENLESNSWRHQSSQIQIKNHYSVFWALWQYRLWSFPTRGMKLERFLPKNQHTQRKSLNFENWISMGLRSFQKSEFQKSNISILPCTKLMNNEILVVF